MKLLRGNPGKRPLNEGEPQPAPLAPACPPELSAPAKEEWNRIIAELIELGLMTRLDRAALAAYCQAYAIYLDAIQAIQKYGPLGKSPNGYPQVSPYLSIANKQAEIMIRIASEFGFTPASRSRIMVGEPAALPLFESADHSHDSQYSHAKSLCELLARHGNDKPAKTMSKFMYHAKDQKRASPILKVKDETV